MPPRRACDVCSQRKVSSRPSLNNTLRIQCSIPILGRPCDWCGHQGIACTFTRESRKKSQAFITPEALHQLYIRIEQLEDQLHRSSSHTQTSRVSDSSAASEATSQPGDSRIGSSPRIVTHDSDDLSPSWPPINPSASSWCSRSSSRLPLDVPTFCGQKFGLQWYVKGVAILSDRGSAWVASRTGQDVVFDESPFLTHELDDVSQKPAQRSLPGIESLPAKQDTQKVFEFFISSSHHFRSLVLEKSLFQQTITEAYDSTHLESGELQAPAMACVWALHAVVTRLQGTCAPGPGLDDEIYISRAQALASVITEVSSLEALQAILLMQTYHLLKGEWRKSDVLHPLACRMVCDLGGHYFRLTEPLSVDDPSIMRHYYHIRQLFWVCYMLDKDVSLRTGKPPLLTQDHCDLTLAESTHEGYSTYTYRLGMIKEKICRLLYSPRVFSASDSQLLLNIRQLDDELEQWRLSVPPSVQPQLSIPADRALQLLDEPIFRSTQRVDLQLEYHSALIYIHKAVRRCGTMSTYESLPEDLHSVMHSSIDLSLEAARSMLRILEHIDDASALRYISAYAPIAAMASFVNIIVHPSAPRSRLDQELLLEAAGRTRSILSHSLSDRERCYTKRLGDFIMELGRLADCAIRKAREDGLAVELQ